MLQSVACGPSSAVSAQQEREAANSGHRRLQLVELLVHGLRYPVGDRRGKSDHRLQLLTLAARCQRAGCR